MLLSVFDHLLANFDNPFKYIRKYIYKCGIFNNFSSFIRIIYEEGADYRQFQRRRWIQNKPGVAFVLFIISFVILLHFVNKTLRFSK